MEVELQQTYDPISKENRVEKITKGFDLMQKTVSILYFYFQ